MIGRTVGNYRVEKLLGAGGMGMVYLVRHVRLPNTVAALKVLTGEVAPAAAERFVQEAVVAAAIGGERVARPIDIGRFDDGAPYILMDFVEGETVADRLKTGSLPTEQVIAIAFQIADTMALAHARGIIHRDLKPSNVMVAGSRLKLLDFGVARAKGKLKLAVTHEAAIIGSPGYMSPEAASGLPADEKTDVFSLGIMIFKMASNELPFPPVTTPEALTRLLTEAAPTLSGVPPDLAKLVAWMLSRDSRERPTMVEVRDRLLELGGNVDASLARTTSVDRVEVDPVAPTISHIEDAEDLERVRKKAEQLAQSRLQRPRSRWPLAVVPLALLGIAAGLWLRPPARLARAPISARQRQLTFGGDVTALGVSPDGATLAYRTATQLVFQRLADASVRPRDLTGGVTSASWLPDSSGILLKLVGQARPILFPLSGEGPLPIGEAVPSIESWTFPAYSLDGRSKAVWLSAAPKITIEGPGGPKILPLEWKFDFVIAVAWSPDSSHLAVVTRGADHQLACLNLRTGRATPIAESRLPMGSPVWGPRGIFYILDRAGGGHDLMFVPMDGEHRRGDPRVIIDRLDVATHFYGANLWLAGSRLFYTRKSGSTELWLMKVAAPESERPRFDIQTLMRDTSEKAGPTVAPDGLSVAYAARDGEGTSLFVVPTSGGAPRRVAVAAGWRALPAWSPDGKHLAFVSRGVGTPEIVVTPLGGGQSKHLPAKEMALAEDHPLWAPGSRILYVATDYTGLAALDPESGVTERLASPQVPVVMTARPAPDGQDLAFLGYNRDKEAGLWLRSGSVTRRIDATGAVLPIGWSRDGKWIYAVANNFSAPLSEIMRVPANGGAARPWITLSPDKLASECDVSSNATLIACVSKEDLDVWSIDDLDSLVAD